VKETLEEKRIFEAVIEGDVAFLNSKFANKG
jgi:hypothetical protein